MALVDVKPCQESYIVFSLHPSTGAPLWIYCETPVYHEISECSQRLLRARVGVRN